MKLSLGDGIVIDTACNIVLGRRFDIQIHTATSDPAWDRFLANTCHGHHVQSSFWAQVKALNHWKAVRVIVRAKESIVGGAQLLIRSLPLWSSVVYVSKGPILLEANHLLAENIIKYIIWVSHQYHAQLLVVQPPGGGEEIATLLQQMGFEQSSLELAPIASLVLDLGFPIEHLLAEMKRQTGQNIRRVRRWV